MHKDEFQIHAMCKVLEVSRSGYYRWQARQGLPQSDQDRALLQNIQRTFNESRKSYGSPRIYKKLRSEGIGCGRHRIARLMRQDGLVARRRRQYKKPVSAQRIQPLAGNILNREFRVTTQDSVWACDVSYFWTHTGWIHLAIVMDLYSRRVIGWSMNDRVDKELTQNALHMALANRQPNKSITHHSDQGAEYTNKEYQTLLKNQNMTVSMSRKANCYDNAVVESFFKTIKAELARKTRFRTQEEARSAIFDYIEVFYNRERMHSTLGYLSPAEFECLNSLN